jgi:hypothetical protein
LRYLDSKSRFAYAFYLGLNSGTICTRSIKSNTVSRNTTDAELKALGLRTVQNVWLKGFFKELGFEQLEPTIIYVDNTAAKYLAESLDNISNNVDHLVVEPNYIKK